MTEQLQQCGNALCPYKTQCGRYSTTAKTIFVPVGKETKQLPAQRICDMYTPKPTED